MADRADNAHGFIPFNAPPAQKTIRDSPCAVNTRRAMDQKRTAFIQYLRKLGHGLNETVVYITSWIVAVGDREPDPVETRILRHVAICFGALTLFEQSDDMCTTDLAQI